MTGQILIFREIKTGGYVFRGVTINLLVIPFVNDW